MTSNQTLIVALVTIIGVIVLVALHDVTATAGLPIIAGLAGVHLGANVLPVSAPVAPTPVAGVTSVTGNSAK